MINQMDNTELQLVLNEQVEDGLAVHMKLRSVEARLADTMEMKSRGVRGKYYLIKAKTGGSFNAAGRAPGGILPGLNTDQGKQDRIAKLVTVQLKYGRRRAYKVTDMDGETFNSKITAPNGVADLATEIIDDMKDNLPEEVSGFYARGQQGILGEIASINKTTGVVTLWDQEAADNTGDAVSRPWAGNRYFREGMVCDAVTGSGGSGLGRGCAALRLNTSNPKNQGRLVTAVSDDIKDCTVTFDDLSGNDWAPGDLLILSDTRQEAAISSQTEFYSGFYNPQGFPDVIQPSTDTVTAINTYVGDVAVSSNLFMQSLVLRNPSTTAMTMNQVNSINDRAYAGRLSAGNFDTIYTTSGVYREMAKQFTSVPSTPSNNQIRYEEPGAGQTFNVGVEGIVLNTFNTNGGQARFHPSPFAGHFRAMLLNKKEIFRLVDKEWGVIDDDGRVFQSYEDRDGVLMKMRTYQTGIAVRSSRAAGALITGLKGNFLEE